MRHKKTKSKEKPDDFELICQLGEQLTVRFGKVRYVDRIFKQNENWTKQSGWERFVNDQWQEIEWTEFENHST